MSLAAIEERACALLTAREVRMRDELAELVAIPTGWNHTAGLDRMRAWLRNRLSALGAASRLLPGEAKPAWLALPSAQRDEGGGAAAIPPTLAVEHRSTRKAAARVLIVGHIDTVHDPAGPFQRLTNAADGRTAVGPGAVDMKGGLIIALHVLEAMSEAGAFNGERDFTWSFLLNSDEETGSYHSARHLRDAARAHDVGVVLEPALADGSLVTQRMGSGQFKIEVFGKSAHVGREFSAGVSAVAKLAEVILRLHGMNDSARGVIVNVGPLVGGAATNVVPDHAACWGNVRFNDPETCAQLEARFDELATRGDGLPSVTVHRSFNRPAKPATDAVMRLARLARDASQEVGLPMGFASTGGVCDGNILAAEGLPTLDTLGVRGGHLHRPDEFVELGTMVQRAQLLAKFLLRVGAGGWLSGS